MPIDTNIQDHSKGYRAKVNGEGSLSVSQIERDTPAIGSSSRYQYLSSLLGNSGADSGTTNMTVDGSVTPVEFYAEANPDYDIRINKLIIVLVDGSIAYNKFGAIAALANGFSISLVEAGVETPIIDSASTTGELITKSGEPTDHTILANFDAANNNAFILEISLDERVPNGIRIGRGTLDKIKATVSDNLTTAISLTVRAIGYKHYPIKEI